MNKIVIGVAAIAAMLAAPAVAADMVLKAPPPAPVYGWTGFYVGGNVGYGWGEAKTDAAGSATTISSPVNCPFGCFTNPPVTFAHSLTQRLDGFIGGGQFGYNYQATSNWVLGFEADIQGTTRRGSNSVLDPFAGTFCSFFGGAGCFATVPLTGAAAISHEARIEWFGTVRGRLGVLINNGLLFYGTGGLAYGRVGVAGNVSVSGIAPGFAAFGPSTNTFGASRTNTGFAAGAGLEGKLFSPNWTWRVEYLYVDLGSLDTLTSFAAASSSANASNLAGTVTTHTRFTDNILRVGLNYQFH